MADKSKRQKGRDGVPSSLDVAIHALNRAKDATSVAPANAAFTSAGVLLTTIRDSMANKTDHIELGLTCADICKVLSRGIDGKRADQLNRPILEVIVKLTTTMDGIHKHIVEWGKRNAISRRYHAKDDKRAIATWKLDLDRILRVFNAGLGANTRAASSDTHQDAANKPTTGSDTATTHTIVSNIRQNKLEGREGVDDGNQATHASAPGQSPPPLQRNTHGTIPGIRREVVSEVQTIASDIRHMLKSQEGTVGPRQSTQNSVPGELPPLPPRVFFGRDELVEKIVGFAQRLTPIALVGAGGIGKTSIVLTVLHDDRIKQQFGDNRRFIRCDKFPASCAYFLRQLSKVTGAGIENPEDLTPLRRYLSSKEMLIVLDNAESILDPQRSSAEEIYAVVDELTRFSNICLCITSRISTIPPHSETLHIPTLPMEAGCDTFYRIYKHGERSDRINGILTQLDFHPLSITLLATVAQHNMWDANRLVSEWGRQRTGVLHAQHSGSLAATVELSLASPMFQELGPDARGLLGVVAFFPQGVNEENINWLFPTISDGRNMFDTFCVLSLTYRSNGFIMMLAPLRDHLCPKDLTSPLLNTAKERYFSRLSVKIYPGKSGFEKSRWITSEDVNIEHLLDVFTSIDGNSEDVWDVCADFIVHLYWHKPRLVMLGPKIEALPDDHPSKPQCLGDLSRLFYLTGNRVEHERLLTHTLKLWRERGDDFRVAQRLRDLSEANQVMGHYKEGIQRAEEASEIFEWLGDTVRQAQCLITLARSLLGDRQLDTAEEAASRAIDLLPEKGQRFQVCRGHRILGEIYDSKDDTEKAIRHFEIALEIASSLNVDHQLFWVHYSLSDLLTREGRFDEAQVHIERTKSHAGNDVYKLGRGTQLQAKFWYNQRMYEKTKSEASHAADFFEKLGATLDLGECRELLQQIDEELNNPVVSDELDVGGQKTEQTVVAPISSEEFLRDSPTTPTPH